MTDNEIMEIVSRNLRGSLGLNGRKEPPVHMRNLHREIDERAAGMSASEAEAFRIRIDAATDKWLDAMQSAIDDMPADTAIRPAPIQRVKQGNGYIGRTVIRAVVWNAVNSIFRAFR